MKLRIQGDSLRLRLTKSEVATFDEKGRVADTVRFGPDDSEMLTYELVRSATHPAPGVEFNGGELVVYLPREQADAWVKTDRVGVQGSQEAGPSRLSILVEKDFRCLSPREGDEEEDLYDHPDAEAGVRQVGSGSNRSS